MFWTLPRIVHSAALLAFLSLLPGAVPQTQAQFQQVTTLPSDSLVSTFPTSSEQFVTYDGALYFPVTQTTGDTELYEYDGSTFTTITEPPVGPDLHLPGSPVVYDGNLYFTANGSAGNELYEYNGSTVTRITDINTSGSSDISELFPFNGALFFNADSEGGLFLSGELYSYDGTNVTRVSNTSQTLNPNNLAVYDNGSGKALYFQGTSSSAGVEIFRSDGTSVSLAVNVDGGSGDSYPSYLTPYDGQLYFKAGQALYRTGGSSAEHIQDFESVNPPIHLTTYDDGTGEELYFAAGDGSDEELYKYDGSTMTEIDVNNGPNSSSGPSRFATAGGTLYFSATVNGNTEIYQYDDGTGSVSQVVDITPSGSTDPFGMIPYNGFLYFASHDGDIDELFRTTSKVPVELASFDARTDGGTVILTWQTASETNNAGFHVQHRIESGGSWKQLGRLDGAGTTSQPQSYRFAASDLGPGTHQFRLKQVDIDGTAHVHEAISVDVRMQRALRLNAPAPNPVRQQASLSFAVKKQAKTTIVLYNVLGQKVETLYHGTPTAGDVQTLQLRSSGLSSGVYFVRMRADGQSKTRRLTVAQ